MLIQSYDDDDDGGEYTLSQKTVQTYFLSELCQILTDCENFLAQR